MKNIESIVFNEDCVEGMKRYPDKYFEVACVDPPYGINVGKMTLGSGKHKFKKGKSWDNEIPNGEYWKELFRVSKNQVVWGGNYFTQYLPPSPHWIVWDKKNPNLSFAEGELIWMSFGKNLRIVKFYSANPEDGGKIHPTQKPVSLYTWLFNNYTEKGDKILDTHLGSGSSRMAAYTLNLPFVGFEIDSEHYQDQEKRFKDFISQQQIF